MNSTVYVLAASYPVQGALQASIGKVTYQDLGLEVNHSYTVQTKEIQVGMLVVQSLVDGQPRAGVGVRVAN